MIANNETSCAAFHQEHRIASGTLAQVAFKVKALLIQDPYARVLIFDDISSHTIKVDFRGSAEEVLNRLPSPSPSAITEIEPETTRAPGPGRPKLGVTGKEITLLPRHWDWLSKQPGRASVVIRKLVEEAKRTDDGRDRLRLAQESTYRFMSTMAGNQIGFEEATLALFACDQTRFNALIVLWPTDIRDHVSRLAAALFEAL